MRRFQQEITQLEPKKKHSKTGCAKMRVVWVLGLIPAELVFSLPSLQGQVHLSRGIDSVD